MTKFSGWFGTFATIVILAGPAMAADGIASGRIKDINANKKEFVLVDGAGKDWTIKLADDVIINRGGKETQADLKPGDPINVCYEKGALTWTAHYILVQEGEAAKCVLVHGTVKTFDPINKQVTLTDDQSKDWSYPVTNAKVRLNNRDGRMDDVKVGDKALALVEKDGERATVRSIMIERK